VGEGCLRRHRLSVTTGTQKGTPVVQTQVGAVSRKLADYLPAKVVEAFKEAGLNTDLYQWQVHVRKVISSWQALGYPAPMH
jgi:hypothetical protein